MSDDMNEKKRSRPEAEGPAERDVPASDAPAGEGSPGDRVEEIVGESLEGLRLTEGFVERVMAALPSREEMRPALHPALRLAFGITTVLFSAGAWSLDLPGWYGAGGAAREVALGALTLWGAFGAAIIGLGLMREAGRPGVSSLRAMFEGPRAKTLLATVGAIVILVAAWTFMGWFPPHVFARWLTAARTSVGAVVLVLFAVAALQLWIMARGRDWKPALRLVEAVGLVVAGLACAANYVIFVA
jgi:hypothetical protein